MGGGVGNSEHLELPWFFERLVDRHLVLLETEDAPGPDGLLTTMLGQLLATFRPGTVRLLLIDPLGLGDNFRSFAALRDLDPDTISGAIWSAPADIRRQLQDVVDAIGAISQNQLRDTFATIDAYNAAFLRRSGTADQPYRFLVVSDFPEGFDTESVQLLGRIMANGPRCGVHVFLRWNAGRAMPHGTRREDLMQDCMILRMDQEPPTLSQPGTNAIAHQVAFQPDQLPDVPVLQAVVQRHGEGAAQSRTALYPFADMLAMLHTMPRGPFASIGGRWTGASADGLAIPLGQAGADRIQPLLLGQANSTTHHAVVVGGTGSGKSNLLHVIIQALAELYPPNALNLYLVDAKGGSEFAPYARHRLPHARVVALDSDPQFIRSVIEELSVLADRREKLFSARGVKNLSEFQRKFPAEPMPRLVAVIDEFQKMFQADATTRAAVQEMLANIVREGRSRGIHLILATQTLKGVEIPIELMSLVGARIVLLNAEDDWDKVLSPDNRGPRILERVGQALLNEDYGKPKGNKTIQLALAPSGEALAERLQALRATADAIPDAPADLFDSIYIYDGANAANPSESDSLRQLGSRPAIARRGRRTPALPLLVGEPIAMRPTHALPLRQQSGSNLLVLTRDEQTARESIALMLASALAQRPASALQIDLLDLVPEDLPDTSLESPLFEELADRFPHAVQYHEPRHIPDLFEGLAEALAQPAAPGLVRIILIFGLHRARSLWDEGFLRAAGPGDQPAPAETLSRLLQQGPERGLHVLLWCDSFANLAKAVGEDVREFGLALTGRLDSAASSRLFDTHVAADIAEENRLMAFDREAPGDMLREVRMFRLDEAERTWFSAWLEQLAAKWQEEA